MQKKVFFIIDFLHIITASALWIEWDLPYKSLVENLNWWWRNGELQAQSFVMKKIFKKPVTAAIHRRYVAAAVTEPTLHRLILHLQ